MAEDPQFKAEFKAYINRKQALEMNMATSNAFLLDPGTTTIQKEIEVRSNYQSGIKGNSIFLVKAISNVKIHNYSSYT